MPVNPIWLCALLLLPIMGLSYISWHVWILLPLSAAWRSVVVGVGVLCFLTLFLDFTGQLDRFPLPLARLLYDVGTSSVIVMLYLAMLFLILDLGRLVGLIPRQMVHYNWATAGGIAVLMLGIFLYGRIHYNHKVRIPLELKSQKLLPKSYRMVMLSDLHLGYHNGRKELARWVDILNREQPDVILIAGDLIDISVRPLLEEDMAAELRRLQAPVYACLGNHEYYASEPKARQFYKDAGIRLLIDEAVELDDALVVIGRDDRTNPQRRSLQSLMKEVDKSKFTIVLDHQPYVLAEAERAGIDLQMSGHTHRGQVWPISWITDRMYECSWGQHRRGKTNYYVSSGLGIWGGRFRIGTQSEYVVVSIK